VEAAGLAEGCCAVTEVGAKQQKAIVQKRTIECALKTDCFMLISL
jgi:hypothetical protein